MMSVGMTDDVVDSTRLIYIPNHTCWLQHHIHTPPKPNDSSYNIHPLFQPTPAKNTNTPSMSQQPTGTNNMDNPGLIAGHAQYVKGAAEVRLFLLPSPLSFTPYYLSTPTPH